MRPVEMGLIRVLLAACVVLCGLAWGRPAEALILEAQRARMATIDLRYADAESILEGAGDSPEVLIERGRLALYRGRCDDAVAVLQRSELEDDEQAAYLLGVSLGCQRVTAGNRVMLDEGRGVWVRFHDSGDEALFPLIVDAAARARDMLERDLGTRLPNPVRIDLLRDQLSLSAMSGLSEQAAQTTGTVAIAKFGRVMMLSPRASEDGYPWLDTLAHEMTHLVLSQATRDRAPLWLQEGVAKRQEARWRATHPFDSRVSHDAVAYDGIKRGIDLPLTGLGPSIAMLPSAEQAGVAFAEVASFVDFYADKQGDQALPKLLAQLRDALPGSTPSDAIEKLSGRSLAAWEKQWRAQLAARSPQLPAAMGHASDEAARVASRKLRIGELLLGVARPRAAAMALKEAFDKAPSATSIRCAHTEALVGEGRMLEAARLMAEHKQMLRPSGRWWSLHAFFGGEQAIEQAQRYALALDPLHPGVACGERPYGEYPTEPNARALCIAAWQVPRAEGQHYRFGVP